MTEAPAPTIEERLAALEVLGSVPVILGPGETLIIRTTDLNPSQMRDYQEHLDGWHQCGELPFRAIVVHGDELAAAGPAPEPPAFPEDVHEAVFESATTTSVCLTHLPTGVTAQGPTREAAAASLSRALAEHGGVNVNTIRALVGLPPFTEDFTLARRR